MSALMSDILDGSVTPGVANTVCNAGARLLQVVQLQLRYAPHLKSADGKLILVDRE